MLLYYSSLEEKFKVYREQQLLELKAQEDQLMQAMIARDPALAERFIEAKAEAKPEAKQEAKPEATMKKEAATPEAKREAAERSLKKKEDINVLLIADLTKKLSISNKGLKSIESSRQSSTSNSPKSVAPPSEAPTVGTDASVQIKNPNLKDLSGMKTNESVKDYHFRIREIVGKMKFKDDKVKEDLLKELFDSKTRKEKINAVVDKIKDTYPTEWQAASISGNGLRTKRCKVHF